MPRAISQLKKLKVKQRQKVLKHRFFQKFVHHQKESIFSKQLKLKKLSNRIKRRRYAYGLKKLCHYVVPKLKSADYQIGSADEKPSVTIQFVDSNGNDISDQKKDEIKNLEMLDENDLGLAHDFNKIFNEK